MSLLSCLQISFQLGRCVFYWLSHWPKGLRELHGFSSRVLHLQGWKSCTISHVPIFVAKIQNSSVHDLKFKFTVPSLDEFMGGDSDGFLLCPIGSLKKYLSQMKQYFPDSTSSFVSTSKRKKRLSWNISFRIWLAINHAYTSASEEDYRSLRTHKVQKVATSLLYRRNCVIHHLLKAVTWPSQSAISVFYIWDALHRHRDTISITSVVVAIESV